MKNLYLYPKKVHPTVFFLLLMNIFTLSIPVTSHADLKRLEEKLKIDIEDFRLDDFRQIEAAFILSGIGQIDSLEKVLIWYEKLLQTIQDSGLDPFDRVESAKKVFNYLHTTWLLEYQTEATTLLDVVKHQRYNCVSGTILYNLLCTDLGWATKAFETPTHTYTIFTNFTQPLMVENTNPMGFDILRNLKSYSRYLAQFYPRNQVLKIGLDRLYAYENSRGREIDNTELLGLLAYNQAYFSAKKQDFNRAYDLVLLAQQFNRDSRSNVPFEIDLTYRWGKQLFDEKHYVDAFGVFADGYYRYPENKNFLMNTKAAFSRALQKLWNQKRWKKTDQLLIEMIELNILEVRDFQWLVRMMWDWAAYFFRLHKKEYGLQVIEYLERWSTEEKRIGELREALNGLK